MRRIGMALCAVAMLVQLFAFPVSAAPATTAKKTADLPAAGTLSSAIEYNAYVEGKPTASTTKALTVAANKAKQLTKAVTREKDALRFSKEGGYAVWSINAPASGWYSVAFTYEAIKGGSSDIELGLHVDGKLPYAEADHFLLPRIWVNDGDMREDTNGNQFAPEQKELIERQTIAMRDVNGFVTDDLCIYLKKGTHSLKVLSYGDAFRLYNVKLGVPDKLLSLEDQLAAWKEAGVKDYTGEEVVIEAELSDRKNDRSIIGKSDNSNPGVQPSNAFIQKVNYIGGSNWSLTDEYISWKVKVPEAGLYKLGFHFRQNYLVNASSYRSLKVNGEHQYAEQKSIAYYYKNSWQFNDKLQNGEEILVYLNKGENELSLAVTLGDMSSYNAKMENVTLRLGNIYREIIAIIGENPDAGRDYDLFTRIPDLEERLTGIHDELEAMIDERTVNEKDIDDNAAILKKMNVVLERMCKKQYEAQTYKSNYYDCYSSMSAQLQEMKNMALDLDCIVVAAPGKECARNTAGFFKKTWFGAQRFAASFLLDYNTAGGMKGEENLTIWVNWSRDQTLVLNSLINSHFTPDSNIGVTVRMTNASLLQGIMSGNGPDCSLSDSRTTPVNLAMRGALVDLTQFEDYDEVSKWFVDGAAEPYRYGDGIYGLPSTQQFYMMFVRTDIFDQYGLEIPKTWDEFVDVASILMMNNMQVGLPYVELKDIGQVNGGVASLNIFPSLLLQKNLSLYNKDMTGTSFNEVETMKVFQEWTDYYTKYNLPKEYSFFNRFRIGLVPLAIQSYAQYSTLAAAAPEIKGRWVMAEIPGTVQADGSINNAQAGFGSACMILELSEHKEAAWELLKWWMSEDIQYRYALDIEAILGVAGRYTSANVDATMKLDWGKDAETTMLNQWNDVEEIIEIPGGYYVSRAIDQAFWNVLSMNENPKDMMKKWGEVADVEIQTKIDQYKDDRKEGAK